MVLRAEATPVEERMVRLELDVARIRTDMARMQGDINRLSSKIDSLCSADVWEERAFNLVRAGMVLAIIAMMFRT